MKILKFKKTKTANLDKFPAITFDKKITSSWETFKRTAYNFILKNNFHNFLNWPIIKKTMFVIEANYLNFELNYIKNILENLEVRERTDYCTQVIIHRNINKYYFIRGEYNGIQLRQKIIL